MTKPLLLLGLLTFLASPLLAKPPAGGAGMTERFLQQLDLSEDQEVQVRPYFETFAESVRGIRARRQSDELSRFDAARELRAARETRDEGVLPLLDEEQRETYLALQEKFREGARRRLREHRQREHQTMNQSHGCSP